MQEILSMLGLPLHELMQSDFVTALNEKGRTRIVHDRFYVEFPKSGIAFDAELDGRVATVFMFSCGAEQDCQFSIELPEGISFTDSQCAVRDRLGLPSATGGGELIEFLGKSPKWDRFDRSTYSLHVEYRDDELGIRLLTLMCPDALPR